MADGREGHAAIVTTAGNGCGINAEQLSRVVDHFDKTVAPQARPRGLIEADRLPVERRMSRWRNRRDEHSRPVHELHGASHQGGLRRNHDLHPLVFRISHGSGPCGLTSPLLSA